MKGKNKINVIIYVIILLFSLGNLVFAEDSTEEQVKQGNSYYENGKYDLAEKYWKMAADKGNIDALYALGILYEDADKLDLAEKYYKLAADKGDADAQYNLGVLYDDQKNMI